jgi:hypothetical protein
MVAMALSVLLFCTLQSALTRFNRGIDTGSPERLVTRNAVTFPSGGFLPARKEGKDVDGGATDWTNAFQNLAVDAEPYFAMSPELALPPAELRAFLKDVHPRAPIGSRSW